MHLLFQGGVLCNFDSIKEAVRREDVKGRFISPIFGKTERLRNA